MQKYISFIAPYSLVISLLYLFGFWSSFDINVLEYITLSDVIKNALYPLLYSSIFLFLGFVVGQVISLPFSEAMPPGGGANLPEAKYIRGLFIFIAVCILGFALYLIFFEAGNTRWFTIASLVFVPVLVMMGDAEFASTYIPNKQVRLVVVNTLMAGLIFSFGLGAVNAKEAKDSPQIIKINGKSLDQKYIGWAGDFLFLWDKSKKTISAISKSKINSIEFEVPEKKPILNWYSSEK